MTLMFGNLTTAFVQFGIASAQAFAAGATPAAFQALVEAANAFKKTAAEDALYLVFIGKTLPYLSSCQTHLSAGLGMLVATYIYMVTWIRTAETAAKRIRENYLRAILRQDIAFFDNVGAGEVATRIQTDTHLVQTGVSEKVPMALSYIGAFVTGFIIAFIRNWKLSLAISSIVPCIAITGGLMNVFMSKLKLAQLTFVAEGGSLAEEVIGTIRTAQAFGTQQKLAAMYDLYMDKTHAVDNNLAIIVSTLL